MHCYNQVAAPELERRLLFFSELKLIWRKLDGWNSELKLAFADMPFGFGRIASSNCNPLCNLQAKLS
ncbi:hypothetical protein V6N12_014132 [Hibiscus sabdariffa]|uniref:Uncharacterized protein n=1 Tax=Hibiscus sabdariffa TaxID=183260 RepID=A0ABR2DJ86_9ROSI